MAKRIVYSDKAFADIDRIIEFNDFRNKSTTYSRKFVAGLKKRLSKLLIHPLSGMKTDDADVLLLIWDNYYVFINRMKPRLPSLAFIIKKKM